MFQDQDGGDTAIKAGGDNPLVAWAVVAKDKEENMRYLIGIFATEGEAHTFAGLDAMNSCRDDPQIEYDTFEIEVK